jgi:hypothetical protein
LGLELDQGSEVLVSVAMADQGLDQLVNKGRQRKRHLPLPGGGKAQIEVLAEELGGEGRVEVEVDEGRAFITGKCRTHHAIVKAVEECLPADPALLRENSDLGQRLRDHAEEEIVAELDDAGELAVADIGGAGAQQVQVRLRRAERVGGPGDGQCQLAGARHPGVAHHRRGQQRGAALRQLAADVPGGLHRDRGAVHHDRRCRLG